MALQERSEHFQGNAFGTPNGDVRMKGLQIRIETSMQDCILNTPMQRKEMGMSFSHSCPNYRRPFPRPENTDTAQGRRNERTRTSHNARRRRSSAVA